MNRWMLIKKNTSYRSNNKGFTLVELVVVLLLMSILLGTAIYAGLGWQDWAQFRHEEAVAEDIFYAAQNQLTELDSSGALYRKVERPLMQSDKEGDYNTAYLIPLFEDVVYNGDGDTYDLDRIWTNTNKVKHPGALLKLQADAGDYEDYLSDSGLDSSKAGAKLLFDLVSPYISDKSVLNGSIIIEFSPDAGQVFSVLYSDRADSLVYGDGSATEDKTSVSVMNRVLQERENVMLGYFCVDNLTKKVRGRGTIDTDLRLRVDNNELLSLVVEDAAPDLQAGDVLRFNIYDGGQDGENVLMTFSVNYDDILFKSTVSEGLTAATAKPILADVIFDNQGRYKGKTETFRLPVFGVGTKGAKSDIYIVLDAADLQAQTLSYSRSIYFPDAIDEVNNSEEAFRNTFSFYRFGLSETVNYIYADMVVQKYGSVGELIAESKPVDSYNEENQKPDKTLSIPKGQCAAFASFKKNDDKNIYEISNMRHFYNVRYETDYKVDPEKSNIYKLVADLSWNGFVGKDSDGGENYFLNSYDPSTNNITRKKSGIEYNGNNPGVTGESTADYPFPGFRKLDKNDTFTQDEDTKFAVSDLTISITGNITYGVYGKEIADVCKGGYSETQGYKDSFTGNNASQKSDDMNAARAGKMPLGLFAENLGSISNIILNRHVVKGMELINDEVVYTCMVGGFAGNNIGQINNLTLLDNTKNSEQSARAYVSKVNGRTDVGGIIGRQSFVVKGKERNVTIKQMKNYATVSGLENIGGIVGRAYTRYVEAEGDESFEKVYGNLLVNGNPASDFYDISRRYYSYHDGYSITDSGKSMTGEDVDRNRYITIENCTNRGNVSGDTIAYDKIIAMDGNGNTKRTRTNISGGFRDVSYYGCAFIGGIAGITMDGIIYDDNQLKYNNSGSDETKYVFYNKCKDYIDGGQAYITVRDCDSYVINESDDLTNVSKHKSLMYDNYVGGLIGYSKMTAIENCNKKPEADMYDSNGVSKTYVFGKYYVGGLIGCSDMSRFDVSSSQSISEDGYEGRKYAATNYNNVIGFAYVGGIAGGFGIGDGQQESFVYREPSVNECSLASQIRGDQDNGLKSNIARNLLNTGIVLCPSYNGTNPFRLWTDANNPLPKDYRGMVGGIAGISRTAISNSDNIQSEATKKYELKLIFGDDDLEKHYSSDMTDVLGINSSKYGGNCSGGLVGYVHGNTRFNHIQNFKSHVDAIVYGQDFVGGVFGYSREGNKINDLHNVYPYKKSNSSGMLVIGQDVVGGFSGLLGRETRFTIDEDIDESYTVKGRYAVGGISGTCHNNASDGTYYNIKVNPDEAPVNIHGIGYVGGYMGITTSDRLGTRDRITVDLDNLNINAKYFAGGAFGAIANSVVIQKSNGVITGYTDSLSYIKYINLGNNVNVNSHIFAGGISGLYTVETDSESESKFLDVNSKLFKLVNEKCKDDLKTTHDNVVANDVISANDIFDKTSDRTISYNFDDYGKANAFSNKVDVTSDLFAGGLFGYVPNGLNITIKGFVNNGNIKVNSSINNVSESADNNADYSYMGGVIGRVPAGMKLVNCANIKTGNDYMSEEATYIGGLTEVNAGVISGDIEKDSEGVVTINNYLINTTEYNYTDQNVAAFAGVNGTIAAGCEGVIQYVQNQGTISSTNGTASGIAAAQQGASQITNSINLADITSGNDSTPGSTASGIVSSPSGTDIVTLCRNYGVINGASKYGIVGGKVGQITKNLESSGLNSLPIAPTSNTLIRNFYIFGNESDIPQNSEQQGETPPTQPAEESYYNIDFQDYYDENYTIAILNWDKQIFWETVNLYQNAEPTEVYKKYNSWTSKIMKDLDNSYDNYLKYTALVYCAYRTLESTEYSQDYTDFFEFYKYVYDNNTLRNASVTSYTVEGSLSIYSTYSGDTDTIVPKWNSFGDYKQIDYTDYLTQPEEVGEDSKYYKQYYWNFSGNQVSETLNNPYSQYYKDYHDLFMSNMRNEFDSMADFETYLSHVYAAYVYMGGSKNDYAAFMNFTKSIYETGQLPGATPDEFKPSWPLKLQSFESSSTFSLKFYSGSEFKNSGIEGLLSNPIEYPTNVENRIKKYIADSNGVLSLDRKFVDMVNNTTGYPDTYFVPTN